MGIVGCQIEQGHSPEEGQKPGFVFHKNHPHVGF